MDSQWLNQEAATKMNGYDQNNDDGKTIDLTLKLGLPNSDNDSQHLNSHEALSVMGSQLPNSPLHYNNLSINPSNNIQPTAAASAQASMKSYTLINVPASRNQQMGTPNSSTAASPRRTAGIPRPHSFTLSATPMGLSTERRRRKGKQKKQTSNSDQDSNNQTA
ncbi:hypothetical protein WN943_007293 [Citrus x changshan-huyou]